LNIKVPEPGSSVDEDGGKLPENVTDIGVLTSYEEEDSIGREENSYRDVNDYRKFTLSAKSSVDINLTGLTGNANLQLIDGDGSTVLNTSANGGSDDEKINLTLDAGDYCVRVFPRGAAKTDYTLNMSASEIGESIDNEPPGIALGTVTVGADPLTQGGDLGFTEGGVVDTKDYYSFDITQAGFVDIKLDDLSDNADLKLYDETGEVELGSSNNSGNTSEEINSFLSADTTYVVGVFGLGNQTPYDLSISL
ncbi:MAG: PPC domain-containing protein, partial [Trichodesmium erythraeum GBRTRLIN201]|nr:PPC domain-containing protein [Trichodesmium erythraeum GBRTRLIN201]